MKSFTLLSLLVPAFLHCGYGWPTNRDEALHVDIQDGQTGVLMAIPPRRTDLGTKRIPDADHPFIAPGPNDQRGPCPAMNTLANHGYISRNGISTFEEVINASGEAFNIDVTMASSMAAVNFLTRGNVFVNKISIGGVSPLVPPLPFELDGPATQGIAKHGRFEGDASMTRSDVFVGDNRNFNQTLWDGDLEQLTLFGDDGPDGPATVFNVQTLIALQRHNLEADQALDPEFSIPPRRLSVALVTPTLFITQAVSRTTQLATKKILSTFLVNQTFPENWYRAATPVLGSPIAAELAAGLSDWVPGHNDENGVFVADPPPPPPFNISVGCTSYWDQLTNGIPGTLANVTGIFKQNVDLLAGIMFNSQIVTE
ncbi:Chloroperoxidase [Mycena metata]|uniref:Chloroperoxidase n=1 Tax=Mycena metata TaxID=1033252 RepID=A0AAD7J3R9_9AGAR|nr:Chloroperoxidase [Mycena metata]